MDDSQDNIFARLNTAIEDWNAQLADSHNRLTEKIATAREHLRGMLEAEDGSADFAPTAETAVALTAALEEASALRGALTDAEARIEALEAELRASRVALDAESDLAALIAGLEADSTASQGMALCEAERADNAESALAETREQLAAEQEARAALEEALEASKGRVRVLLDEQKEIRALRGEIATLKARLEAKDDALALDQIEVRIAEAQAAATAQEEEIARLREERDTLRIERDRALQAAEDARKLAVRTADQDSSRVLKWMAKEADSPEQQLVDDPFTDLPVAEAHTPFIRALDKKGHKRRMGDILVEAGLITAEQLGEVIGIQKTQPQRRLGILLVGLGFATEESIAHVLAAQLGLPFVDLANTEIDGRAVTLISGKMARTHQCVPIRRNIGMALRVAFANPLDIVGIENIERATGTQVEVVVATASDVDAVLRRYFPNLR